MEKEKEDTKPDFTPAETEFEFFTRGSLKG